MPVVNTGRAVKYTIVISQEVIATEFDSFFSVKWTRGKKKKRTKRIRVEPFSAFFEGSIKAEKAGSGRPNYSQLIQNPGSIKGRPSSAPITSNRYLSYDRDKTRVL